MNYIFYIIILYILKSTWIKYSIWSPCIYSKIYLDYIFYIITLYILKSIWTKCTIDLLSSFPPNPIFSLLHTLYTALQGWIFNRTSAIDNIRQRLVLRLTLGVLRAIKKMSLFANKKVDFKMKTTGFTELLSCTTNIAKMSRLD